MKKPFYLNAFCHSGKVYLRYVEDGKRRALKHRYQPYLFFPSKDHSTPYRTIYGKPVEKRTYDSMYDARQYLRSMEGVLGFEVYGMTDFEYTFLNDAYPGQVEFVREEVRVGNIDIEVGSDDGFPDVRLADKPITAITVLEKRTGVFHSFACGEYEPGEMVSYARCSDEAELLRRFLDCWQEMDLDIITGWHIDMFDIPYLINRIKRVLGDEHANRLSPWGILFERTLELNGKECQVFTPGGVAVLDYIRLYKKFRLVPQESYTLNHVCSAEIGEKKLDYSEHESLIGLWRRDFQKYMTYNVRDVWLVDQLDAKLGLIDLAITIAFDSKINFDQVFGPVKMWDVIIHNYLLARNVVVPHADRGSKRSAFAGAYVKDPIVGMHDWVVSYDVDSLYPSLIVQHNISPESYVGKYRQEWTVDQLLVGAHLDDEELTERLGREDLSLCANSTLWKRDKQGAIPELVETFQKDRNFYKDRMKAAKKQLEKAKTKELEAEVARNHNMQYCRKTQLNSLYGAMGNAYFRWYSLDFAEAITKTGQLAIRTCEQEINAFLEKVVGTKKDRVVAIDTDSNYVALGDVVKKFGLKENIVEVVDQFCKQKLSPVIDASFQKLATMLRAFKPWLNMKREVIADRGIWTAKKKYVLNVWDDEGLRLEKPKLKVVGVEAVKSSTPAVCRETIKKALEIIMREDNDKLIEFVSAFRSKFNEFGFEQVGISMGVHNLDKFRHTQTIYTSPPGQGCPVNVRAALLFNHHLKEKQLDGRYQTIQEGDKTKFCYLKLPNPIHQDVIGSLTVLPRELGLDEYIDRQRMFERTFLGPVQIITNAIGWQTERISTLEALIASS